MLQQIADLLPISFISRSSSKARLIDNVCSADAALQGTVQCTVSLVLLFIKQERH